MPGRKFDNGSGYRYGFEGQEKSNEIKSEGTSYTAEFWEYNPRLGRRWNIDPKRNASISPYACFNNNPIWFKDALGDSASPPPHELQTAKQGTNDFTYRKYEVNVTNSKVSNADLLKSIENGFNSFVPKDKGYFEKIIGGTDLKKGDEIKIIGGTSVGTLPLTKDQMKDPESCGLSPRRVGKDQQYHLGTITTGVTVIDVTDNSFTFATWKGHPEAGAITFSVTSNDLGKQVIKIESFTSPSNGFYQFVYDHGGGKGIQTQLWDSFITNVGKTTGGQLSAPAHKTVEVDLSIWPW